MANQYFHGDVINPGDRLWVVGKGVATVIELRPGTIHAKVGGRLLKFNMKGVASGTSYQSLYWFDPILVQPRKSAHNWSTQKQLVHNYVQAVGELVAGADIITEPDLTNLSLKEQFMRGLITKEQLNEYNLVKIKEQVRLGIKATSE